FEGLGIARIDQYMKFFGLGAKTGINFPGEQEGVIPTPEWKEETFGEEWRLGNTYHTSIGQFGFLVTPLQMVRAFAAIANGGRLLTPTLAKDDKPNYQELNLDPSYLQVIKEGMRKAVNGEG